MPHADEESFAAELQCVLGELSLRELARPAPGRRVVSGG
jgi:hypothetical protein